jgi:hypothetical protein
MEVLVHGQRPWNVDDLLEPLQSIELLLQGMNGIVISLPARGLAIELGHHAESLIRKFVATDGMRGRRDLVDIDRAVPVVYSPAQNIH